MTNQTFIRNSLCIGKQLCSVIWLNAVSCCLLFVFLPSYLLFPDFVLMKLFHLLPRFAVFMIAEAVGTR